MTTDEYEYMAERFYGDMRLMAPGKSVAPEMHQDNDEERRAAWDLWLRSPRGDMARGAFLERDRIKNVMRRAWEQRCESYDPWPKDGDNPEPHDSTAQHVFDLLLAAVEQP